MLCLELLAPLALVVGAGTKAAAAQLAAQSGTSVLITDAALVSSALRGENVGTWFEAAS
ncbi:hypothetical protein AURUGA1_00744 [Aurantimicrobium sp. MWH-Uga1]|nr:hypothetical protein AURUGA1_00744 [Aurantimicrobium sp. MWH-Uga1]